ncbi:esterase/lipase family protein [Actinomadura craniellae]|uniref:esterase/lipase family protein n=1 Tax=Actinomadura craniellae TaxID=2231787 RepID=UPI001314B177|nr:alpha/beta fold hydrolase [Actinomadura craniellae]
MARQHRARIIGTLTALAVALVSAAVTARPASAASPATEPVLFVHGWGGSPSNGDALVQYFTSNTAHPAYTVSLPRPDWLGESNDNLHNAATIRDTVNFIRWITGAEKVNIVAHSMGGLSTRHYIRFLGGADVVRHYVGMGTVEHGTEPGSPLEPIVCILPWADGGQMCRDGYLGRDNLFLRALNAGDESFGPVKYTVLRSTAPDGDGAVTTRLGGGACYKEIPGVPHAGEPANTTFLDNARWAIDVGCPGITIN